MQGAKVRVQGAKVRTQGAKVRASSSASRYGMQQQHATTTTTTSDRIGPAQHDAAISATCVRTSYRFVEEMGALTQVALIAASCCAGPIRSLVVVVVVACCCCIPYRLALLLALTFAPCVLTFAPCTLTFAPCTYGVSLLSTGATIPLAQMIVVTLCNLHWWCFFIHPLAQILHLHSGNLHCVVVVCVVVVVYVEVEVCT